MAEFTPHIGRSDMQYAGFWVRLGAAIVDGLVFAPVLLLYWGLASISWEVAVAFAIPYVFARAAYNVYFLARWGQTIGKRAYGIKVLTPAGDPIGWRHASLRHSVDMVAAALGSATWLAGLFAVSQVAFESAGFMVRMGLLKEARPAWEYWIVAVDAVWMCSELVVLLLNEKKRAIHDYLAGTVVVVLPAKASAAHQSAG